MLTAGIDLGGTKVLTALVSGEGRVLAEGRMPTPDGGEDLIDALAQGLWRLAGADAAGGEGPRAVGVGAAGMIAADGSVAYGPNVAAFREGFPLQSALTERLGLPVVVDNDANMAAWGEVVHGAAEGHDDALVITLGTGIGGGIVLGGRPYRGARGFAAEIGHFQVDPHGPRCACGEVGHWEALACGPALGRMGSEAAAKGDAPEVLELVGGDPTNVTGEHVGAAAKAGSRGAAEVVAAFAEQVAIGLAGLANILDPGVIVVGGGLIDLGDLLLDPLRAAFDPRIEAPSLRPAIPIVAAELGERAGAIGAAALARDLVAGPPGDG